MPKVSSSIEIKPERDDPDHDLFTQNVKLDFINLDEENSKLVYCPNFLTEKFTEILCEEVLKMPFEQSHLRIHGRVLGKVCDWLYQLWQSRNAVCFVVSFHDYKVGWLTTRFWKIKKEQIWIKHKKDKNGLQIFWRSVNFFIRITQINFLAISWNVNWSKFWEANPSIMFCSWTFSTINHMSRKKHQCKNFSTKKRLQRRIAKSIRKTKSEEKLSYFLLYQFSNSSRLFWKFEDKCLVVKETFCKRWFL